MSAYLFRNEKTKLSIIIFSIRSKTFDLKEWRPWQYADNLCVKCEIYPETTDHFVTCEKYGKQTEISCRDILEDYTEKQKHCIYLQNGINDDDDDSIKLHNMVAENKKIRLHRKSLVIHTILHIR